MENIELYLTLIIALVIVYLIINTILYYKCEKRKIKHLHRFAKNGEVDAQRELAKRYYFGDFLPKNKQLSAFWCQKALFSGDETAKDFLDKILNSKKEYKC